MVFRPVADDLVHHRHDEKTVGAFVDGMRERAPPLHVFHFDCFWMRVQHWCDFEWNRRHSAIPRACWPGLKAKGLRTWVWINPYIADRGYSTKAWPRARSGSGPMAVGHELRRFHQPKGVRVVRGPS